MREEDGMSGSGLQSKQQHPIKRTWSRKWTARCSASGNNAMDEAQDGKTCKQMKRNETGGQPQQQQHQQQSTLDGQGMDASAMSGHEASMRGRSQTLTLTGDRILLTH